jgi:CRP-like cAMP-binding protein
MTLAESELLAGLTPEEAAGVLALGTEVRLAGGEVLFGLGSNADHLYLVKQGRIALTLPIEVRGQGQDVLIEERGPGQAVGWSALIPPHRFTLKATAQLGTDVIALPRAVLTDYLAARPALGYRVARNVAAVVGQRLQVVQAMWLREMQRVVKFTYS